MEDAIVKDKEWQQITQNEPGNQKENLKDEANYESEDNEEEEEVSSSSTSAEEQKDTTKAHHTNITMLVKKRKNSRKYKDNDTSKQKLLPLNKHLNMGDASFWSEWRIS